MLRFTAKATAGTARPLSLPNAAIDPGRNPAPPVPERHPMATPATPVVERADDKHRYEILVDGELAGFTEYLDRDEQRVFYHTEIDETFAGQGLASRLVQQALTDVRKTGKRVVPVCPYVAGFLQKHGEFADIADPVTRDVRQWLHKALG
ncbi:GNAT family N-acetyltransferase [Streptomyces sp. NPDC002088]|uniref:GNAT family N-acetyltransferase n=1 Tax=Streptomyces sp. NPDC002088 TaxID=3154665 RepID=UPI00332D321C